MSEKKINLGKIYGFIVDYIQRLGWDRANHTSNEELIETMNKYCTELTREQFIDLMLSDAENRLEDMLEELED